MARTVFVTAVIGKICMWAVMWVGVYFAIRAFMDDEVGIGLLILFILIPLAMWGARIVLALAQMIVLVPLAFITGRRQEFMEFTNFQLAVVDELRTDRLKLRQGRLLLRMFRELPPPEPGQPTRSGPDLLALYEELDMDDDLDEPGDELPSSALR